MIEIVVPVILVAMVLYCGVPVAGMWSLRKRLAAKVQRDKKLVLTFDDGPGTRLTPAILALLAEYDCKATFFLLGRSIVGREDIVRQIQAEGHEIGSHGYGHLHHWRVGPWRALKDVTQGWEAINTALGVSGGTYPFRPPYGKLNALVMLYLRLRGVPVCFWTADSTDTWPRQRRDGTLAVAELEKTGGAVVLAHDFDRNSADVDALVLQCIDSLLETARARGIAVSTFSEFTCHDSRS